MRESNTHIENGAPTLLFDGVCNLCNWSVQWILRKERKAEIRFGALQSSQGEELLKDHNLPLKELESLVFIENGHAYTYSSAALHICRYLKFPWKLFSALLLLPKFLRDPIYRLVAKNRYKWFGRREQCMVPNIEWKKRFLE